MGKHYAFKRNLYYDIEKTISDFNIAFLLGPRKTGKTVCMQQIQETYDNAVYYDLKAMKEDDGIDLIDEIKNSISNDEPKIYLIDETSYWTLPEKAIADIAHEYAINDNHKTKIVFAGSQSVALEAWASRAFAGNAKFIYSDFLSYPEWLAYKGMSAEDVSAETYDQFLIGTREFYDQFKSLDEYLKGCIEETIHSNYQTSNVIWNNSCDSLNEQKLKNIMYAALVSQADRPSLLSFFDQKSLDRKIKYSLKDPYRDIGQEEVRKRIDNILSERMDAYSSTDFEVLKRGYVFLQKCGLVTLTHVSPETQNFENVLDISEELCKSDSKEIKNKDDLFKKVNICIKYPMFYTEILKEILGEHYPEKLKGDMLGGVVECHTRGILPQTYCYEYHNMVNGREHEIDYVHFTKHKAIEISTRNKNNSELRFDDMPPNFEKILLTQDENYVDKYNIIRIPYYQFIYDNSDTDDIIVRDIK